MITLSLLSVAQSDYKIPTTNLTSTSFQGILQAVFGLAGAIALIIIILAGFKYVMSQGNPNDTAKAKNTIIYASVGLGICILAFSIVTLIVSKV